MSAVPTIDLSGWFFEETDRQGVARQFDAALKEVGFLVVTGHGVDPTHRAAMGSAARAFVALPSETKRRYAVCTQDEGWADAPFVEPLGPPIGRTDAYEPVVASDFLKATRHHLGRLGSRFAIRGSERDDHFCGGDTGAEHLEPGDDGSEAASDDVRVGGGDELARGKCVG